MAAPPPKPRLSTDQRSALVILAASQRGLTKVLMLADGFTRDMLAGLVLAGLATTVIETVTFAVHEEMSSTKRPA